MRKMMMLLWLLSAFALGALSVQLFSNADNAASESGADGGGPVADEQAQPLYWYDPMYPQQKFDAPGKSPFMDMMLVPKYADEGGSDGRAGSVRINPQVTQNLGVRSAVATLGSLRRSVNASGAVSYDERLVSVLQTRVDAIVERLLVRAPLQSVRAGQPLLVLLAPDWTAAQEEYLSLRRASSGGLDALRDAARRRLLLLGMSQTQIAAVEISGQANARITLHAPRSGVVGELLAREGASLTQGMPLMRINGLETVWIEAQVAERDAQSALPGTLVAATFPAFPDRQFAGSVEALLPAVDARTRTIAARIVMDNKEGLLAPGMYAQLRFQVAEDGRQCVLVPSEAVIATGTREVLIVVQSDHSFRAQEVRVGHQAEGMTEILDGLEDGEEVVLSGQFLIDSEASLSGALSRLAAEPEARRGEQ